MSQVDYIGLEHEVDIRKFVNFIQTRGMKVLHITPAVATKFAVWFECTDAETAHQHKMEFFEETRPQR